MSGNEEYKYIEGYEGMYSITHLGRVYSHDRRDSRGNKIGLKFLKFGSCAGYHRVTLCKDGVTKEYTVHRLVAKAFVEGYFEGAVVNHIDEDKHNNHYTNLEWCTVQQNNEHSHALYYLVTFPCGKVEKVHNMNKFCKEYLLNTSAMGKTANGVYKQHKGFKCSYIEEK